jgi:carboxypeptidase Taq
MHEEQFYGAINYVEPSLIRVEADEVTYGLHICLRFEIEQALFDGSLQVKDLPAVWNEKIKSYFELTPPNDAQGVLQDIHWAHGSFGYFPTYLKGTLFSAQWWYALQKDLPNRDVLIGKGDFAPIKQWLNQKIHLEGKRFWTNDLTKHVTGETLTPSYFISYLKEKFSPIYAVSL